MRWHGLLDRRWEQLEKGASPTWLNELRRREAWTTPVIPQGDRLMRKLAEGIAYSQSAPSDAISRLLATDRFKLACEDYSVEKLAAATEAKILAQHWKRQSRASGFARNSERS